ncbi:MAG: SPOR domain-containing protein [Flavobacteriaceae bacterium]|nr:SPOR domain-containing protein [Flavobacteriaceae bacterium]
MNFQTKKIFFISFIFCVCLSIKSFAQQTKGIIRIESNAKIDRVLAQKKQYNNKLKTIKGFKIQLYYGGEDEAYKINNEFKALFSEIPIKIIFSSPEWKVQVGNYKTRLEADRFLIEIKKEYPSAIIFATNIHFKN